MFADRRPRASLSEITKLHYVDRLHVGSTASIGVAVPVCPLLLHEKA